jgi:uncharacterized DUF497 family protein
MFSWDTREALKNYEKHGVPFEEAERFSVIPRRSIGNILNTPRRNSDGSAWAFRPAAAFLWSYMHCGG